MVELKFYLEMNVTTKTCQELDRYGLTIQPTTRATKGYMFDFSCDGRYSLWIWNGEESQYKSLVGWTKSDLIRAGSNQTNRIGIKVDGKRLFLYANGSLLFEAIDKTLEKVYFGVYVGATETDNFTVEADELDYWVLQ
jgi:hypothetical protein